MEYVSLSQLAVIAGIPETSVRRYAASFAKYLETRQTGRAVKYKQPDTTHLLQRVYELYQTGYTTREIEEILKHQSVDLIAAREEAATISVMAENTIAPAAVSHRPCDKCQPQEELKALLQASAAVIAKMAAVLEAVDTERKEISLLQARQQKLEHDLDDRDFRIMKLIRSRSVQNQNKKWWNPFT